MLDTFNRPDETPVGLPYVFLADDSSHTLNLTSHQLVNTGLSVDSVFYSGAVVANGRVAVVLGNTWLESGAVRMRWSEANNLALSGDADGYTAFYSNIEDVPQLSLFRRLGESMGTDSLILPTPLVAGDRLEIECRDDTIELWTQKVGGARTLQLSAVDSTYSEGRVGIRLSSGLSINAFEFTSFGAEGSFWAKHVGWGSPW